MEEFINQAPKEWGRFLGIRAELTPVPIIDFENLEIYVYE